MKKIFLTIITSLPLFQCFGQVDTMNMTTGPLLLEARDAEFISSLFVYNKPLQDFFFNDIRYRFRTAGAPTGTTVIQIDSVKIGTLMFLSTALRSSAYRGAKIVYNRIDIAIRNCKSSFLANYLEQLDKKEVDDYNAILLEGRKLLTNTP